MQIKIKIKITIKIKMKNIIFKLNTTNLANDRKIKALILIAE